MLTQNTVELRKLILENPELPIVVFAGEYANRGDHYYYQYCTEIRFRIKEILDCDFYNGYIYSSREDFENDIANKLAPKYKGKSDKKYKKAIQEEIDMYKPYWKKVIAITVDN